MKPANIYIDHGGNKGVYLNTLERGDEVPLIVKRALNRATGVWNEPSALTRVIFSELVQGNLLENSGYGIGPYIMENYQYITVVNPNLNKIGFFRDDGYYLKTYSFAEYASIDDNLLYWHYVSDYGFRPTNTNPATVKYSFSR